MPNLTLIKKKQELIQDSKNKDMIYKSSITKFKSLIQVVQHTHTKVTRGRAGNPNFSSIQETKNRNKEITGLLRKFNSLLLVTSNHFKIENENLRFFFETFSGPESLKYLRDSNFTSEHQVYLNKTKYINKFNELEKIVYALKNTMPYVDYMKFYRNYQNMLVKLKQYNTVNKNKQTKICFDEQPRKSN